MYPIEGLERCTEPKPGDILVCDFNFDINVVCVTRVDSAAVWGHWGPDGNLPTTRDPYPLSMSRQNGYYYFKKLKRNSGFAAFVRGIET